MSIFTGTFPKCRLLISRLSTPLIHEERQASKSILGSLAGKGKITATLTQKKRLPAESDVKKLVNYCCGSNIYKEGEDVKLKDDSEYPDWLWTLRLGPPPPLEEMDPNTKEYWEHFFFLQKIRELRLKRAKIKKKLFVNEGDKIYLLRKIRFRALAHQYDPGFNSPPRFDKDGWRII
ncbi:39S ribosomal protein L54, mitochondrial-like [Argiope bruennichi]|uniref:39S ribosomal protein L54, mitochondrial-like n=1 Tax=Argiope bruennichi TaxID=94029 RepID=UPI002494FD27|nr:39S ribosomal protein L54, mitochondrial-like [Argiope bruennichi]